MTGDSATKKTDTITSLNKVNTVTVEYNNGDSKVTSNDDVHVQAKITDASAIDKTAGHYDGHTDKLPEGSKEKQVWEETKKNIQNKRKDELKAEAES